MSGVDVTVTYDEAGDVTADVAGDKLDCDVFASSSPLLLILSQSLKVAGSCARAADVNESCGKMTAWHAAVADDVAPGVVTSVMYSSNVITVHCSSSLDDNGSDCVATGIAFDSPELDVFTALGCLTSLTAVGGRSSTSSSVTEVHDLFDELPDDTNSGVTNTTDALLFGLLDASRCVSSLDSECCRVCDVAAGRSSECDVVLSTCVSSVDTDCCTVCMLRDVSADGRSVSVCGL